MEFVELHQAAIGGDRSCVSRLIELITRGLISQDEAESADSSKRHQFLIECINYNLDHVEIAKCIQSGHGSDEAPDPASLSSIIQLLVSNGHRESEAGQYSWPKAKMLIESIVKQQKIAMKERAAIFRVALHADQKQWSEFIADDETDGQLADEEIYKNWLEIDKLFGSR
ncbi:MAG: hypothetical protein HQL67_10880 [Magnetococcales bacterium]|nr:hypothetical protein [Magnetococcales bacterium]